MTDLLKLKKLEMTGFRSFTELTTIHFPESGAVLISGNNLSTGGSSGSGKSSVVEALAYVLGFCSTPATVLKSRYSSKMSVVLTLTQGDNVYVIGRYPQLKISINGEKYKGSTTGAEEVLAGILKSPTALVKALTYREQRGTGQFINSTDSQKKEFLSKCLKLKEIEEAQDLLKEKLSLAEDSKDLFERQTSNINDLLPSLVLKDGELEEAKLKFEAAQKSINQDSITAEINNISYEITTVRSELSKTDDLLNTISQATYQNQEIKRKATSLHNEIETLSAKMCPMCKREWDSSQALLEAKTNQINELKDLFAKNSVIIKNKGNLTERLGVLNAKLTELVRKQAEIKAPFDQAQQLFYSAKSLFETLQHKKNEFEKVTAMKNDYIVKAEESAGNISTLTHSVSLLGRTGFLGAIFDEVLKEIEDLSNNMIADIPNIAEFTLSLSSTSATQKGKVKAEIKPKLYLDGLEVPFKSLSGGQKCSIELCTDLAVSEVIRARSGSSLGWVALDEAMDGLDVVSKTEALEMIKKNVKGTVLVIDHATEVKEGFESIIEINFDGRTSVVV